MEFSNVQAVRAISRWNKQRTLLNKKQNGFGATGLGVRAYEFAKLLQLTALCDVSLNAASAQSIPATRGYNG